MKMKWFFHLIFLGAFSACTQNLMPNPGFETVDKKNAFASGWDFSPRGNPDVSIELDSANPHRGKYSARVYKEVVKPTALIVRTVYFRKPLETPRRCVVSYWLCGNNVTAGYVVFSTGTKEKLQLQWLNLGNIAGTFEWRKVSKEIELKKNTEHFILSFRLNGSGTLWIDDVSVEFLPEQLAFQKDFSGRLSGITYLPEGWNEKKYDGNENFSEIKIMKLDGKTVAAQEWKGGAPKSGFSTDLPSDFVKMKAIRVQGNVKSDGKGKAVLGLELLDKNGMITGETLSEPFSENKWGKIDATFMIPADSANVRALLLNTGNGNVWFDGILVREGNPKEGKPWGNMVLEAKIFPVSTSSDQLGGEAQFNTFVNSPVGLAFHFKGDISKFAKPALLIDLPSDVKIADVFTTHPEAWRAEKFTVAPVTRREGAYRRWRIENPRAMQLAAPNGFLYQRKIVMALMPEKPAEVKSGRKVFWHLENGGQAGPEESFILNFLPPMAASPNPKRFKMMRWDFEDMNFSRNDVLLSAVKCMEEANYIWSRRYPAKKFPRSVEINRILAERGWKFMLPGAPSAHPQNYTAVKNRIKLEYAVDASGKIMPDKLCPEFVVNDPAFIPLRDEVIQKSIQERNPRSGDYLVLDFEDWSPMDWCFCLRCRTAFAKKNNLVSIPDAALIKKQYAVQWRDFRRENGVGKIRMIHDVVKKFFPGMILGDYTYVTDYRKKNYENFFYGVAKDAVWNAKYLDMQMPSYYHILDAAAFDMMQTGRKKLNQEYIPLVAIDGLGYLAKHEILDPARFRMMCLNAAVTGCEGVGVYPGDHIDGTYLLAMDRAMAEIAVCEEYFLDGGKDPAVSISALPYRQTTTRIGDKDVTLSFPRWENAFRWNSHKLPGKGTLVSLLNYHTKQTAYIKVKAALPQKEYAVIDPVKRKRIPVADIGNGFLVAVPPRDARFVEIIPVSRVDKSLPLADDENTVRENFRREQQRFLNENTQFEFKPVSSGAISMRSSDLNGDTVPEIEIITPAQKLYLDLAHGGTLMDWQVNGIPLCPTRKNGEIVSEDKLWLPASARHDPAEKSECRLVSAEIRNQRAEITLERRFTLLSLKERKTFLIPEKGMNFAVRYEFTNTGKQPLEFSFWNRNAFNPSVAENVSAETTFYLKKEGKFFSVPKQLSSVWALKDVSIPLPDKVAGNADEGIVFVDYPQQGFHLKVQLEKNLLAGYYFWQSPSVSTLEWIYLPVRIFPGKTSSFIQNYSFIKDKLTF